MINCNMMVKYSKLCFSTINVHIQDTYRLRLPGNSHFVELKLNLSIIPSNIMSVTIKLHYKPVVLLLSGNTEATAALPADYRAASLLWL